MFRAMNEKRTMNPAQNKIPIAVKRTLTNNSLLLYCLG
jgi:hypothetical protein